MLPTARRGDVCLCVCVPVQECSFPLGWGLVFVCVCLSGMMPPLVYCVTSVHTTGQLRARQHSVCVCACVCHGGLVGGESVTGERKRKEVARFVSRRRLTAGSH